MVNPEGLKCMGRAADHCLAKCKIVCTRKWGNMIVKIILSQGHGHRLSATLY